MLGISLSGAGAFKLTTQTFEFFYRCLDRVFHAIEKWLEFLAALARVNFRASDKPAPYLAPPIQKASGRNLAAVVILTIACALAVGGASYAPKGPSPIDSQRPIAGQR